MYTNMLRSCTGGRQNAISVSITAQITIAPAPYTFRCPQLVSINIRYC